MSSVFTSVKEKEVTLAARYGLRTLLRRNLLTGRSLSKKWGYKSYSDNALTEDGVTLPAVSG